VSISPDIAVIVIGGGPAGAATALALARHRCTVLLAEEETVSRFRIGESLPPDIRPLLQDLELQDSVLNGGHLPCFGAVSVWGDEFAQEADSLFNPHGHGWHLDRSRFDAQLRDDAERGGVAVRKGVKCCDFVRTESGDWAVRLHDPSGRSERVTCSWLVDATGRRSCLGRWLGLSRVQCDRLVAFHARFGQRGAQSRDQDARTWIESVPDGWWYSALVPEGTRIVAFFSDSDLVDRAACLSRSGFLAQLAAARHLQTLLREFGYELHGRPQGADACTSRLSQFAGPGWLAVGDAALSFDPLSSLGIHTALRTGLMAGQTIARALSGDSLAIPNYMRRLQAIEDKYRRDRAYYYKQERRWVDSPFWRRRHNLSRSEMF
jgi:flavin-dependent dehydrogenase